MGLFRRNGALDMVENERQHFDWNTAMPWVLTILFGIFLCFKEFWSTQNNATVAVSDVEALKVNVAAHDVKLAQLDQKLDDMDTKIDDIGQDVKSLVQRR